MTDTDITDRFVIEVSRVGTVDHIVDLKAEPADRSPYSPRRDLPGEKLCDRSTRSPASEFIELRDYADWKGLDKTAFDGVHDYLTPHGGRRGAGDVLYREDPVLAQTALRHRSIETTKDSYSYIEAGETASRAGEIFEADPDDQ